MVLVISKQNWINSYRSFGRATRIGSDSLQLCFEGSSANRHFTKWGLQLLWSENLQRDIPDSEEHNPTERHKMRIISCPVHHVIHTKHRHVNTHPITAICQVQQLFQHVPTTRFWPKMLQFLLFLAVFSQSSLQKCSSESPVIQLGCVCPVARVWVTAKGNITIATCNGPKHCKS